MENLKLYHPLILSHSKQPFHFFKDEHAQFVIQASNPICGDRFTLFISLQDQVISKASFHGYGCVVSKAATSMLVERMYQKSIPEVIQLTKEYLTMLENGNQIQDLELEIFKVARDFPGRTQCARLSWEKLSEELHLLIQDQSM